MTSLQAPLVIQNQSPCTEHTFPTFDGAKLFFRHWSPRVLTNNAMILFHRGHEHSGRFSEFVEQLNLLDCHVFAWDARGHGQSPGERGYAENFAAVVQDMDCFVRFIAAEYGIPVENMLVLGHSVGAVAVAAWVHDFAPRIRAMVLATPAFRVKLYIPLAIPALRLRNRLGKSFIKSYVRAKMLTHDPVEAMKYNNDPLISRNIATNILLDLHDTATRLLADAGAITTPTLLLTAGKDWVVNNSANRKFFKRISSPVKEMVEFEGFHHAILHEKNRDQPIAKIRQFYQQIFSRNAFVDTDTSDYTAREVESLSKPLPPLSPKWFNFVFQKLNMKTLCKLSDGIRLGWKTGFDSGETLDYVYRNQPQGISPLGRFIDRQYLNSIGWTGIRLRKTHLQEALRQCIREIYTSGGSGRILDIAAGGGRYALEVLKELSLQGMKVSAMLRDRSSTALTVGRQTAVSMGLKDVAFIEGDAFDTQSLARIEPRPNIAIVSGLYELFGDNSLVRASLAGLAAAVPVNGFLIYTNQPWHPQIEMIARVLINRDGKPWIMRRRTQAEMDELVAAAGFEKISMKIDTFGIFTVSIARRIA
jgi:alpha-beta hydrolase superfamily lysophospholipase